MSYKVLLSDDVVFEGFRRGDEQSFMKVYQAFKKAIYAFTIKMVGSAEDAEDLTVEAFHKVWERRENIQSMAHLKNALFVYARNSAINFLESKRRTQVELTTAITDEVDTQNIAKYRSDQLFVELVEDVVALIEKMPKLRAKVFRMRYLEERSVEEVAEALGMSVQSVYWHTKEALAQTREALAKRTLRVTKAVSLLLVLSSHFLVELFSGK